MFVGVTDGSSVGAGVGSVVGDNEGDTDGTMVGDIDGTFDGADDGANSYWTDPDCSPLPDVPKISSPSPMAVTTHGSPEFLPETDTEKP